MFQTKNSIKRKLDAQRKRLTRQNESSQVRETNLKSDVEKKRSLRKNESADQRTDRLKNQLDYQLSHYEDESADKRISRLQRQLKYQLSHYEGESADKRISRLQRQLKYQLSNYEGESADKRSSRLQRQLKYQLSHYEGESADQRTDRLKNQLDYQLSHYEDESSDKRTSRINRQQKYQARRCNNESSHNRTTRLSYQRLYKASKVRNINSIALNIARSEPITDVVDTLIEEHSVGSMEFLCSHCGAKFWKSEKLSISTKDCLKFSLCCGQGKVVLPSLATPPELLIHLLTATDTRGRTFRDNIRAYNSALAFASLGVNLDKELANARRGVYTFRIHGVVHHYIGQLRPREGEAPSFAQIYIHDGTAEGELESRLRHLGEASLPELKGLQVMLHEVNPYVTFFKQGVDLMKNIGDNNVRMIIRSDGTPDPRRYNAPSAPEIAVIIPGDGYTEGVASRDIVLHEHTGGLQRITESHCAYDSLHYVLLFPLGENGWHLKIPHSKGKGDITAMEFYSFRLMVRSSISYLHLFGRLFHQYLVDMFAKIEQQRLNYIKFNQQKIRVDLYSGLADAISAGDSNPREVGRRVILPSSFTGSPRQMFELYQDSMSIVRKYGKPDLFITFTCNPKWEEISSALLFNQKATDRPDLIVRVFRLKLRELLKDICNNHVLGRPLAHVYTIEFQKRGLPHAHILVILESQNKPKDPSEYDKIVCAEIPDSVLTPRLHSIVKRCMMHNPCGVVRKNASCMRDGKCTKKFPKQFAEFTTTGNDTYPVYRRRDNNRSVQVNGIGLDNRWVVPYNPYLLLKYNAHINVEICSTVSAVKYLYKYVYKGHDRAIVEFRIEDNGDSSRPKEVDEIVNYLEARYVSATESCYRLFAFDLHANLPHVMRLALHLENQQSVVFSEHSDLENVLSRQKHTTLTGWFIANQRFPSSRDITYTNFPDKFVWEKTKREWKEREKGHGNMIGRVYSAHPGEGERFYLRMLLSHVTGCTSYQDIRSLPDGTVCPTYKEAARRRGLLDDDQESDDCLTEISMHAMPSELRELFVNILLCNEPTDPLALWNKHKESLAEDFLFRARIFSPQVELNERILNTALLDIENRLETVGKSLSDFPDMPVPNKNRSSYEQPRVIQDELDYSEADQVTITEKNISLLNTDQLAIFNCIIAAINQPDIEQRAFFIDGPGGTGKTFLYNALLAKIRSQGQIALAMASSGIAALLLQGGRTVHSRMKVPISLNEQSICNISKQTALAKLIQNAKLLVWDEAPMIHKHAVECIDRSLRDLCSCELPFGGKVIAFGGDFRQILPVIRRGTRSDIVSACINRSSLWHHVKVMQLTINMRLEQLSSQDSAEISEFSDFLLRVGEGIEPHDDNNMIHLDEKFVVRGETIEDLATTIYRDITDKYNDRDYINARIMMSPKNETTEDINEYVMNLLPGEAKEILSADYVDTNQAAMYPTEFLNSIKLSSLPPHRLYLKQYASVILLRSLNPTQGLCNGTRLTIKAIFKHAIDAEIMTGNFCGKRVFLPRIKMIPSETDFPFVLRRKQFPIRPAFCITINKGQGQSLGSVGVFLPTPEAIFSHGQLYVALSRVQNPRGLKIMVCGGNYSPSGGVWVRNVVYKEVFQYHLGNIHPSNQNSGYCSPMDLSFDNTICDSDPDSVPDDTLPFSRIDHTGLTESLAGSVNQFSLLMRNHIAMSLDMQVESILPIRSNRMVIVGSALESYDATLEERLSHLFGNNFELFPVVGDGNCLYRALAHIIFGTETTYEHLKFQLIHRFRSSPLHKYNVMKMLHYSSEEDLNSHLDLISNPNEWGTDVVLAILGSLSQIDMLVVNATHTNPSMWGVNTIYDTSSITTQSNPVFCGQKLGVVLHRLHNKEQLYHLDPFYYN